MKNALFFLLFLLFASASHAQDFKLGFKLGVNGAQLDGDGIGGYNKAGLYAGLFVARDFNERVFWQLEMAYSGKGSQRVLRPDNLDEGPWLRLSMHYIDIPFTVHYRYKPNWSFHAGMGVNFLVNYSYRDLRLLVLNTNFTRFETAIHLGTTLQLMPRLEGFGRYSYSLLSIDPNAPFVPFFARLQAGSFNNVVSIGLRYQLQN